MTRLSAPFVFFALIAVAHLAALAADWREAASVTQIAAMPVLALALVPAARQPGADSRLVRWTLLALGFSWLGDTVPRFLAGDAAFVAMVGGFLLAQLAYIAAFAPRWRTSMLAAHRVRLVPYAALFVALVVSCLPHAGALAPLVTGYGITLVSMAILASGINRYAWIGGALFFVSDGLIALRTFAPSWPLAGTAESLTIMTTYFAAQALLVAGVLRAVRVSRAAGEPLPQRRRESAN